MIKKHNFDETIMREYDIRGIVDDTLHSADAYAIGLGLARIARQRNLPKTAMVGYDGRPSSSIFAEQLLLGLAHGGFDTTNIGLCPTPTLYYGKCEYNQSVAVQITGSHNPANYNGFKIVMGGKPFFGDDIRLLNTIAQNGDWGNITNTPTPTKSMPLNAEYIKRIVSDLPPNMTDYNIVWDCGNGVVGAVIHDLVAQLPGNHTVLFADVDGNFPNHHPDPTVPENLKDLIATVQSQNADFGIAFDGDGDRIGLVDGQGRILWGDQMLMLLAREVLAEIPNAPILADVKASQALFDEITRLGGRPIMVPTGHSIVKHRMVQENAPLAGEMSAHIFYSHKFYGHDDALYVAIRMMNVIHESGESLSALYDQLPKVVNTPEIRIDVAESEKFPLVDTIKQSVMAEDSLTVSDVDGVRVSVTLPCGGTGWWLIRASNTQSVLVARAEADTPETLSTLKKSLTERLQSLGLTNDQLRELLA